MAGKLPLSVAIVTFNEEKNLLACLQSIADIASEIVVVDAFSTDRTVHVAEEFGARVEQRAWPGFIGQKNHAFGLCTQPWILGLDADERVSPDLLAEMQRAIEKGEESVAGFQLNRKAFYLGRWIEHAWYPDWIVRLGRRGRVKWEGNDLHPFLKVDGIVNRLGGDLHHFPYPTLQAHLERTIRYAKINAEYLDREGMQARWHHVLLHPIGAFLKKMVLKGAWLDGVPGVIIAFSSLVGVFAKYSYLYEMQRSKKTES